MIFRPYYYNDLGCAAYLLGCGSLGRCAVVDARGDDIDGYLSFAREKQMAITHVIDTHVHADHLSGGYELARRAGAVYHLHQSSDVALSFVALGDGDVVELGNTLLEVVHTPGHSPESICLVGTDLKRGSDPWFVLTGDTLFVGAVGRPDLPGNAREHAAQLHESIHKRLLTLPDGVEVYPGHFSGSLCGTGLSGKPSSTIAFERRWNPLLSLDVDAFVDALADVPDKPEAMLEIMHANRGLEATAAGA